MKKRTPSSEPVDRRAAKIVNRTRKFDGFFKLDELTIDVMRHDGKLMTIKRLMMERGHAASILVYDPRLDEVVLISEMRPGNLSVGDNPFSLSVVAGMIDPGENGLETVLRELFEEAGLRVKRLHLIKESLYVSPGGTSEKIDLYCGIGDATKAKKYAGKKSEGEDIKTHRLKYHAAKKCMDTPDINDMKTYTSLQWLQLNRARLRREYRRAEMALTL